MPFSCSPRSCGSLDTKLSQPHRPGQLERVKSELNPKNLEKGRWTFELSDHAVVTSEFLIKQPSRKDAGEVMEKDRVAEACNNLL